MNRLSISLPVIILAAVASSLVSCKDKPVSFLPTNAIDSSYVHIGNGQLLDSTGTQLKLNGVSTGGWLLWEAWEWGGGLNSETWIMNTIESRTNAAYAQDFRERIYANFITRDDIIAIHELGFNAIRVPFNHAFLDNGINGSTLSEAHFELIDRLLQWCEEFHVYVILDMHAAPGGQNPLFISDPDNIKLWGDAGNQEQMRNTWKAIAARYKKRKIVLGYDLLNEPVPTSNTEMANLYASVITSIRGEDSHHLFIVEGSNYAKDFSVFQTLIDNNQIFSFHFYPWLQTDAAQLQQLQSFSDFADQVHAPMWCGEWGEASPADLQQLKLKLDNSNYNFCGRSFWTWKKVKLNSGSYPLQEIHVSDQWIKMINNQVKTLPDSYESIADGFLDNVIFSNTSQDPAIANATR